MKKILSIMMVGFLLLLTACSGGASGDGKGGEKSQTLKLGALYPLSGGLALLGEESFRGAELAIEEANKNGGIAGGKTIELVKGDAVDADAAQSEANRLINQENIKSIFGSYSSSISFAASEVAERSGVLYWELGAVSDSITDRQYKYVLRTNPPASYFSKVNVDFIKEVVTKKLGKDLGDIKVAIAHEDSSYGTTIADEATKLAKEEGINIVANQGYSAGTNDLSSVILNIKKVDPDVVIAVSYLNDAILLARQSEELGLKIPVFIGNGGGHTMADFKDAMGEKANGIFDIDFPQYLINKEFTPGIEEFMALYKEKYGTDPRSGHSLANYMGMKVVLDVLDKVGEVDPDKLKEEALKYTAEAGKTVTGWGVEFNQESGQNKLSQPYVHQWINGELKTVWPENVAVEEPQIVNQ
ncbi:ABC transporter substrate-binding protein [Bacillus sp. FJAT-29937]|uniref:ABC transporter substrate-binding protein n=1 Tax=Bacillus sp. FJAT-29937 TaxID=1720553 RepID=UPI00082FD61F|nr:ABC transporter substrate-binding protein [Bacillus sp. FJAT-29937]